jgi:DNA polymerase III epsilon subunit-like protein
MIIHFCDTETTGITDDDEVIQLCIARWVYENGAARVEPLYHEWFMPVGRVSEEAARVNGYTEAAYAGKPRFSYLAAEQISKCLEGLEYWAGSNPSFDERMLRLAFKSTRTPFPKIGHRKIDLSSNAFPLMALGKIPGLGMNNIGQYFGFGAQTHTAEGDVMASIKIFELLTQFAIEGFKLAP